MSAILAVTINGAVWLQGNLCPILGHRRPPSPRNSRFLFPTRKITAVEGGFEGSAGPGGLKGDAETQPNKWTLYVLNLLWRVQPGYGRGLSVSRILRTLEQTYVRNAGADQAEGVRRAAGEQL